MANKVTGKTDTTGALSTAPLAPKSVLLVGQKVGTPSVETEANKVFSITGTADTVGRFGEKSKFVKAVRVLVQNGVDNMYGIIVDSTVSEGKIADNYGDTLAASLGERSVKCILLDSFDDDIITQLKTHLAMAESEDMFRYAVVANSSSDKDELITYATTKLNDSRIFMPGPAFTDGTNATDPVLVAAGLIGEIMSETSDPALPMNGVKIRGIGAVDRAVLESERNVFATNGITAIYNDGDPVIHRLVTTAAKGDPVYQEGTTRFIADYVLEGVETVLRATYKRTKNIPRILDSIRTTVKGKLQDYEGLEIIENFDDSTLTVVKDPQDAYGALIDYEFDVVTPLYTITINQHLKL